ncbi:unnamed protein product [Diplocarpon coronariae]
MKSFLAQLPCTNPGRENTRHQEACSERLLPGDEAGDDEKAFRAERNEGFDPEQLLDVKKRLCMLVILAFLMTISLCSVIFSVSTLRDGLESSPDPVSTTSTSDEMKLQIIIPSFACSPCDSVSVQCANRYQGPHFPELLEMLHSMACLVTDISAINVDVILSSEAEVSALQASMDDSAQNKSCTSNYLNYNTTRSARLTYPPTLTLHNLYDIVPPSIQELTLPQDTSGLVSKYGKYKYQSVKKLAAAAYLDYDYAIILDSEGLVIRPLEFREMVREWSKRPVIWKELAVKGSPRRNDWIAQINEAGAHVLGRTMQNFGPGLSFWDGYTWILEKPIVTDMVTSPSRYAPGADFFTRLLDAPADIFEIVLYKIHVAGRKMEQASTNSSLYTKYRILDMQETLVDSGLGAAYNRIPADLDVISERFPYMILEESLQDLLVGFMREYRVFFLFFRPKFIAMIPRGVLGSFLRRAPVAMTVSGASGLKDEVIPEAQRAGEWNMTYTYTRAADLQSRDITPSKLPEEASPQMSQVSLPQRNPAPELLWSRQTRPQLLAPLLYTWAFRELLDAGGRRARKQAGARTRRRRSQAAHAPRGQAEKSPSRVKAVPGTKP